MLIPASAIIPTRNRSKVLMRTLMSLAQQEFQPREIVIVDASDQNDTREYLNNGVEGLKSTVHYYKAAIAGAAAQRNQAMQYASQPFILLMDDDIILEESCLEKLWQAIQIDAGIGGANAMITNQKYSSPGTISRLLYRILHGKDENSYAGKVIGPGFNLLPEDRDELPEVVRVEWLNMGCTIYRKEALPSPLFNEQFKGYSLMEDLALSLNIGKTWKLVNARTARIYHDSQPGTHKNNMKDLTRMEFVNRHFIMTKVLGRTSFSDYLKFAVFQTFGVVTSTTSLKGWKSLPSIVAGKISGVIQILRSK
jgi:glycosyltransferase involved in cell wall biosynthesis